MTKLANVERVEVRARISTDLHKRMLSECGECGCHVQGFIAIAIAHEVANRKRTRKQAADDYLEQVAQDVEAIGNA